MKSMFTELFGDATRLTQSGQLQAATELIQRTLRDAGLGGMPEPAPANDRAGNGVVIDAESRVVPDHVLPPPALRRGAASPSTAEQWLSGSFAHRGRTLAYKLYVPPTSAD